ncbi:CotH kinase family protein [Oscillospiraceae bacterium OttesenSCG-928-F05]|nr:CotH kinase family protein [Oscillospiraceae bacterium OttesenSCG-928-F05]
MLRTFAKRAAALTLSAALLFTAGCSGGGAAGAGEASGEPLAFSHEGGLYAEAFSLSLTTSLSGGVIRYTLDGSDPDATSEIYSTPISIHDRTEEDNNLSAIVTQTQGGRFPGGPGGNAGDTGDSAAAPSGAPPDAPQSTPESSAQLQNNQDHQNDTPPATSGGALPDPTAGGVSASPDSAPVTPDGGFRGERPDGGRGGMGGEQTAPTENVFKGTVVNAAVFSATGEKLSDTVTRSYFVSATIFERYGDLAIVSIVTDAANFYDESTGIYTNYNESGSEWERPAHFELYTADGTEAISQSMGVRLNGNSTRSYAQKSLRFYAKSSYDAENPAIDYELFEGLTQSNSEDLLSSFKRILLRNGGNDNTGTLFRDELMQSLANDLNVDTQASRPCVAFLNGEFWGIYSIRERYDDHYFAAHYGVDATSVAVVEITNTSGGLALSEGDETDLAYANEMWAFFEENDLSVAENYEKALTYLDVDNFIDYFIANIYSGNTDWPGNNQVFWRYKTAGGGYDSTAEGALDGRFRWVLKDMDFGFGLMGQASSDTLAHAMSEAENGGFGRPGGMGDMGDMPFPGAGDGDADGWTPPDFGDFPDRTEDGGQGAMPDMSGFGGMGFTNATSTLLFRKLLQNETFLQQFISRFCDLMNTNYSTAYVTEQIALFAAALEPAIEEQAVRYPGTVGGTEDWQASIEKMAGYVTERPGYVRQFLAETFDLGEAVTLTLRTDSALGALRIGSVDLVPGTKGVADPSAWSGVYFSGTSQSVTALPLEGHTFVKFIVTDGAGITEYTDAEITLDLGDADITVEAVFQ